MQSTSRWLIALLVSTALSAALAQQPAEPQTRAEEPRVDTSTLEPAVDTSAATPDSTGASRSDTSPDSIDPAVDTSAATPAPSEATSPTRGATPAPGTTAAPARGARGSDRALDRLELDTTQITGNRELPRVLYIVPWKRADLGDLVGKPVNSLLDEVLEPVDRDVFRRENRYYRSLQTGTEARAGESAGAAGGPEK
jgi:hypothetical protein